MIYKDVDIKNLFKAVHHIGFYVKNIDEIIELYCKVFGMSLERDTGLNGLGPDYIRFINTVTGIKCSNARIVYLQSFDLRIELIQFMERKRGSSKYKPLDINSYHIGFKVSEIEKIYNYLISKDCIPISKPNSIPGGVNKGVKVVYFIDKNGRRYELMQMK